MDIRGESKIYILGSVASGKTTMANNISKLQNIPWYELDNVVHIRTENGDRKRSPEERDLVFNEIIDSEKWVIEGVYRECFDAGLDKANVIILLDTPTYKRKYRIAKRWIRQRLKVEKANYSPTVKMLFKMYEWSHQYEELKEELLQILKPYSDKVIVIKDNTDVIHDQKEMKL